MKKKILFIGGSLNQTTMAVQVAECLSADYDCYFSPYYCDGYLRLFEKFGWLDFTAIGGQARKRTEEYLLAQQLPIDYGGARHEYDLVVTTSDLLIQKNIRDKKILLIQEGMTDPANLMYYLVKWFKLPRYLASTSTTGLSNAFDIFCVTSEGYRNMFARKGVDPDRMVVTGIPNYDNLAQHLDNDFPHRNYVMVATSDARETLKFDNRKKFLRRCVGIANGRQLIFKLHPNENIERATREINAVAPDALVFCDGNTNQMIANCDVLITQYSTVVYVGIILGKEVHSYFDVDRLRQLTPLQNGGTSAKNIARECQKLLEEEIMENVHRQVA